MSTCETERPPTVDRMTRVAPDPPPLAHGPETASAVTDLPLVVQFVRYLIVGTVAFVADFGVLLVLTESCHLHYLRSAALAFLIGMAVNYALSVTWVFKVRVVKKPARRVSVVCTDRIGRLGNQPTPALDADRRAGSLLSARQTHHDRSGPGMELRGAQAAAVHVATCRHAIAGDGSDMSSPDSKQYAVIIGAGPAGLTAAYELLTRTDVVPIVLEKSTYMGGISPHGQLQGKPHRHRRPSLLFQVGPGDELVAAVHADCRPGRSARNHLSAGHAARGAPHRPAPMPTA